MNKTYFTDKRVASLTNVWHVSGYIEDHERITLTRVEGDITDEAGLNKALEALLPRNAPAKGDNL